MGCLAIGHRVGGLLQADDLPVGEFAAVVHERHGPERGADVAGAALGFVNLTTVDFDLDGVVAGEAAEERNFHVGNDGCRSNDETLNAHELLGICGQ